jgi:hypothetical protein
VKATKTGILANANLVGTSAADQRKLHIGDKIAFSIPAKAGKAGTEDGAATCLTVTPNVENSGPLAVRYLARCQLTAPAAAALGTNIRLCVAICKEESGTETKLFSGLNDCVMVDGTLPANTNWWTPDKSVYPGDRIGCYAERVANGAAIANVFMSLRVIPDDSVRSLAGAFDEAPLLDQTVVTMDMGGLIP